MKMMVPLSGSVSDCVECRFVLRAHRRGMISSHTKISFSCKASNVAVGRVVPWNTLDVAAASLRRRQGLAEAAEIRIFG